MIYFWITSDMLLHCYFVAILVWYLTFMFGDFGYAWICLFLWVNVLVNTTWHTRTVRWLPQSWSLPTWHALWSNLYGWLLFLEVFGIEKSKNYIDLRLTHKIYVVANWCESIDRINQMEPTKWFDKSRQPDIPGHKTTFVVLPWQTTSSTSNMVGWNLKNKLGIIYIYTVRVFIHIHGTPCRYTMLVVELSTPKQVYYYSVWVLVTYILLFHTCLFVIPKPKKTLTIKSASAAQQPLKRCILAHITD